MSAPFAVEDLQPFLARLDGVKRNGVGWRARCPAHEDRVASLSVSEGNDGRLLAHCHAGCSFDQVVAAAGLLKREKPAAALTVVRAKPGIIAEYDYTDVDGNLLYQVLRKSEKAGFPQRRPDGRGGWINNLQGVTPVPYHLPELIEAAALGKPVFIAEGEKDVDNLRALGLVATCNSGGAGKWRDDHAAYFEGVPRAVVLADNDEAGEAHARRVAESLRSIVPDVRIVRFPELPPKGDVSDWLALGHSLPDLYERVEQGAVDVAPDTLPSATCAYEMGEPAPIEWAVDTLWTAGDLGILFADGGRFKTTIALHLAIATAAGGAVFGRFRAQQGPALVVSAEDPEHVILGRAKAIVRGHGWPEERVLRNLHIYGPQAGVTLQDPRWIAQLRAEVQRLGAKVVMLDPLFELTEGDENAPSEQRATTKAVRSLTLLPSTPIVIVVAHAGKDSPGKRKIDRLRGSSSWYGAARVAYYLDTPDEAASSISVECVKMSRAQKPAPFVIKPLINAEPAGSPNWRTARLEHQTASFAALDRAEKWLLDQLVDGLRLTTTELKNAAKGSGISAVAVSKALNVLEIRKLIDFESGEKNAKRWGRSCLPDAPSNQPESCLPCLPADCPAITDLPLSACLPLKGASTDGAYESHGNQEGK